jgi:penicillin-binding protein 1A
MLRLRPLSPAARRRVAIGLGAAAALYLLALGAASSPPAGRWLRARIQGTLRARLGEVRLGDAVRVDPLFRVWFGPVELPSPAGGPPLLRAESAMARPSVAALLRGRAEPASVLLGDVRLRPGPGGADLRALVERLRAPRAFGERGGAGGGRELPKVKVRGLVVLVPLRGEVLEVGPLDADLRLDRAADDLRLRAEVAHRSGGRAALDLARDAEGWRAALRLDGLGAEALPPSLRSRAVAVTGGTLTLSVEGEAPADLSRASARVRAEVEGLVLAGERMGAEPVGPLRASAAGRLAWDRAARSVVLSEGSATLLRAVTLTAAGALALGPETFSLTLRADGVDWGALLAALPPPLAPPPQAPRPSGKLSARLDLAGPLRAPEEWTVAAALDLSALREAARRGPRPALAEPFAHRPPLDGGGQGPELRVGPASPDFVPVAELPEHVIRAVTSSEDAGFFAHPGFDFDELRNAIAQGARRGRLVRGGSTITQQVAKNLFLGPERTIARKVREAAITVGLEASLPKRRILEIYLNVAEWGPGIWGLGPAARHWFGKDARALTPKEAAFLASVIPSPVRFHEALFSRGAPTEAWEETLRDVLFTMAQQGALSEAQLVEALDQQVTFARASPAGPEQGEGHAAEGGKDRLGR